MKRALLTGITGQDGSYLAEFLLGKGYEVFGVIRRASTFNTGRIDHFYQDPHEPDVRMKLLFGDLCDGSSLNSIIRSVRPDEIYNLGAQSHVKVSFEVPEYTAEVDALGTTRLLEAIRESGLTPRFYQASSSELFGKALESPQSETTPFYPRSPYGCAKAYAFHISRNYREAYGFHVSNGILFNHESPRRGETFVTRKITAAVARIKHGLQRKLYLGNLEATRDWGYAKDYVEAMWMMLQQPKGDDYVIATGESHSVREFCQEAFGHLGLDYREFVELDPRYLRPTEVDHLLGDASKAREVLGWRPKVSFRELVRLMVDSDLQAVDREKWGTHGRRSKGSRETVFFRSRRFLVTGGAGFLGSFLVPKLRERGAGEVFVPRSRDYDLIKREDAERLLRDTRPDVVIHLAAKVGGIGANRLNPGSFFYENLMMGVQLIEAARLAGTKKVVAVGTICAYPQYAAVPFKEDSLWDGYPEETNAPYGLAKKMLLVQGQAYRAQYGLNTIYLLPVNMYGPRDNFDLQTSHVIPALIRRFAEANTTKAPFVVCWGDGSATREFIHAEDAAEAILLATEHYDKPEPVNIGSGMEISIRDLALLVSKLVGYQGEIRWDPTLPNGQPRRLLDVSRAKKEFNFEAKKILQQGLLETVRWYAEARRG